MAFQEVTFILKTTLHVPLVRACLHISCVSSKLVWVSDGVSRLRLVNKRGRYTKTVSGRQTLDNGSHTVTREGELLFIDRYNQRHVYRVTGGDQILTLQTKMYRLKCIFSSPRNGDLLIGGEYRDNRDNVRGVALRYNAVGDTRLQEMKTDETGRYLYSEPKYITENMNGDVIMSDRRVLVVVNKLGRLRFTYTGHPSGSGFIPHGVCTDTSGRILVCDNYCSDSVHILTRDGEFLSFLRTRGHKIMRSHSICMDNKQRVWIGDLDSNRMCIYRYSQPQES